MRFVHVSLRASADRLAAISDFYGEELGLDPVTRTAEAVRFAIGETVLEYVAGPGEPFYHFALLVPGDRFAAALEWARARAELLPDPRSDQMVFDFDAWNAQACYFHDPGGNIVELIAHHGFGERVVRGDFRAGELLGISELGSSETRSRWPSFCRASFGLEPYVTRPGPCRLPYDSCLARALGSRHGRW